MEIVNATKLDRNTKWTLIILEDPDFLPGKTIVKILQNITSVIDFKFVVVDRVIGAKISPLFKIQNKVIEIDKIMNDILDVIQFDWADFFLFKNYPDAWQCDIDMSYPEILMMTNTTVRAVDDQYVYIYTPYQKIVETITTNYKFETIKTDYLENLDYPY